MASQQEEDMQYCAERCFGPSIPIATLIEIIPLVAPQPKVYLGLMHALENRLITIEASDSASLWNQLLTNILLLGVKCKLPLSAFASSHDDQLRKHKTQILCLSKKLHLHNLFQVESNSFPNQLINWLVKIQHFAQSLDFYESLHSIFRKSTLSIVKRWIESRVQTIRKAHEQNYTQRLEEVKAILYNDQCKQEKKTFIDRDPMFRKKSRNTLHSQRSSQSNYHKTIKRYSDEAKSLQQIEDEIRRMSRSNKKQMIPSKRQEPKCNELQYTTTSHCDYYHPQNITQKEKSNVPVEDKKGFSSNNKRRKSQSRTIYNQGRYIFKCRQSTERQIQYFYTDQQGINVLLNPDYSFSSNQEQTKPQYSVTQKSNLHRQMFSYEQKQFKHQKQVFVVSNDIKKQQHPLTISQQLHSQNQDRTQTLNRLLTQDLNKQHKTLKCQKQNSQANITPTKVSLGQLLIYKINKKSQSQQHWNKYTFNQANIFYQQTKNDTKVSLLNTIQHQKTFTRSMSKRKALTAKRKQCF